MRLLEASAAFDPKGVVGYVIERGGKWYIEGDEEADAL